MMVDALEILHYDDGRASLSIHIQHIADMPSFLFLYGTLVSAYEILMSRHNAFIAVSS